MVLYRIYAVEWCVLSVKELPEEELNEGDTTGDEEKYGLIQAFKLLVKNKFYLMICGTYILQQLYSAMIGAGIYYMTWVLKNKNLFGQFAWAVNIPLIIALIFTATLVGKWNGMYKLNVRGYVLAVIGRALVVVAGYMGSDDLIYRTVSYVSGNFRKQFSLEDMAHDLGVSKYVLSRVFSKTFHRNFNQYLNDARLRYACTRLIHSRETILDICLDSGFDSQRTFNRVFKERYRITPSEYRKEKREG